MEKGKPTSPRTRLKEMREAKEAKEKKRKEKYRKRKLKEKTDEETQQLRKRLKIKGFGDWETIDEIIDKLKRNPEYTGKVNRHDFRRQMELLSHAAKLRRSYPSPDIDLPSEDEIRTTHEKISGNRKTMKAASKKVFVPAEDGPETEAMELNREITIIPPRVSDKTAPTLTYGNLDENDMAYKCARKFSVNYDKDTKDFTAQVKHLIGHRIKRLDQKYTEEKWNLFQDIEKPRNVDTLVDATEHRLKKDYTVLAGKKRKELEEIRSTFLKDLDLVNNSKYGTSYHGPETDDIMGTSVWIEETLNDRRRTNSFLTLAFDEFRLVGSKHISSEKKLHDITSKLTTQYPAYLKLSESYAKIAETMYEYSDYWNKERVPYNPNDDAFKERVSKELEDRRIREAGE